MTEFAERTDDIYPSIAVSSRQVWQQPAERSRDATGKPGAHIVRKFIAIVAFASGISTAAIAQMPAATSAVLTTPQASLAAPSSSPAIPRHIRNS